MHPPLFLRDRFVLLSISVYSKNHSRPWFTTSHTTIQGQEHQKYTLIDQHGDLEISGQDDCLDSFSAQK